MVVGTKEPTANAQRMWSSHLRWALLFYHNSYYMNSNKNEAGTLLPMTVTEGITVNVLPNGEHEYVMDSTQVASGYGVTKYNIRQHLLQHPDELIEGKHYIKGVSIPNTPTKQPNQIWWTKRGIIRLGFFIKSERAKLFRDWAEELVIRMNEQRDLFGNPLIVPVKRLTGKRLINRLDRNRLIRLLALASRINDNELRIAIINELTGGLSYGNY